MHTVEPGGQPPVAAEPLPWAYAQQVAARAEEPSASRAEMVRLGVATLAIFAILGCLAGLLWAAWADPALYLVTNDNAVMGELEAGRQFGTDVVYSAIAVVAGLLAGSVLGWRYARAGWLLPVVVAIASIGAAVLAWRLGMALGPPDPRTALPEAAVGAFVPERLDVHARGLLLLWPIAALTGLISSVAATYPKSVRQEPDDQ